MSIQYFNDYIRLPLENHLEFSRGGIVWSSTPHPQRWDVEAIAIARKFLQVD